MAQNAYTFVKNIAGGLEISLETYDMVGQVKRFVIPFNVKEIVIPYKYALGLFVSHDALNMYNNGYFTIKNEKELIRDAIEQGLYAKEARPDILTLSDIEAAVKKNDAKTIKKILEKGDKVEMDNLLIIAKENIGKLTSEVIDAIEEAYEVELRIEG